MTRSGKATRQRKPCEHCAGRGYIELGVGLVALQRQYPDLPMREMYDRGWMGSPDEEDEAACSAAFLQFWGVASHEELARKQGERREFPWNARVVG